jgi:hypothetical protein
MPNKCQKMNDIKKVMKFTDYNHQYFWTCILAWETAHKDSKHKNGLKCKIKNLFRVIVII